MTHEEIFQTLIIGIAESSDDDSPVYKPGMPTVGPHLLADLDEKTRAVYECRIKSKAS